LEAPEFVADFVGQQPRRFPTLQAAMAWAEGLDDPTGVIAYTSGDASAVPVVRYLHGAVEGA
jgi:hypothetical protein